MIPLGDEHYRVGSDYDKVKRGVEKLMAERRRRGLKRPNVNVLSLVFKFNYGQQAAIREWGESIGVDKVAFKPVWVGGARYMDADREQFAADFLPPDEHLHHDSWLGENLSFARESFQSGKIGLFELSLVRRDLIDTRVAYLEALADLIEARHALEIAAGASLGSP